MTLTELGAFLIFLVSPIAAIVGASAGSWFLMFAAAISGLVVGAGFSLLLAAVNDWLRRRQGWAFLPFSAMMLTAPMLFATSTLAAFWLGQCLSE